MHFVYQTRYSFFSPSPGWRSAQSRQKELLFDPERLRRRHYFFEKIALQSLADQDSKDFDLCVLTSEDLPEPFKSQLTELCKDTLGDRAHMLFAPETTPTRVPFRKYMAERFTQDPWSCQIVLDDDDAVSTDFTRKITAEARAAKNLRAPGENACYVSHANGVTALFRQGTLGFRQMVKPLTNLGLAVVAPSGTRHSLWDISHVKIASERPTRVVYSKVPYYIRALHDDNDSRGKHSDDETTAKQMVQVFDRFPLVKALAEDWPITNPLKAAQRTAAE